MALGAQPATAQRVLFPQHGDEDAVSLYVHLEGESSWSRESLRLEGGGSASFQTYFGAFPAGYWAAHTRVDEVTVTGTVAGSLLVHFCAAAPDAGRRVVASREFADEQFDVPLSLVGESWLWVEVEAGQGGGTIAGLQWCMAPAASATAAVCITTHDRPDDCVGVLNRIADDSSLDSLVPEIIVVDQGTQRVDAAAGWAAAAQRLDGRLRVIRQRNLGGSGGFSRGMVEALGGGATHVLLLDDDVAIEPESISRMLAFSARTDDPAIVGAQMLSLLDRTMLHSFGERVERRGFWWTPVAPELAPVDVGRSLISATPAMRQVYEVDFNGWWMCLIPREVIEQMGAAVPMFIKWDDVELGLRARALGTATVTLPGAAVWHMPWTGKDDGLDWQAYFQLRNRLVTALLHAPGQRGSGVLRSSLAQDVNHLMCLQYGSAAARRVAMKDVLDGPAHLPRTLAARVGDMRELMARAGQVVVPDAELPLVRGITSPEPPQGRVATAWRLLQVIVHQLTREREVSPPSVAVSLPRGQGKWWTLGRLDSALVRSATGSGAFVARRRRSTAISLCRDAVALRVRLWVRWPSLRRAYRASLPGLTSVASWSEIFDDHEKLVARDTVR